MGRPPKLVRHPLTGKVLSVREWAERLRITPEAFLQRVTLRGAHDPDIFRRGPMPGYRPPVTVRREKTGQSMSVNEWADLLRISPTAFRKRLDRFGPKDERAFTFGPMSGPTATLFEHDGLALSADEWADELRITVSTFRDRVKRHGPRDPRVFRARKLSDEEQREEDRRAEASRRFIETYRDSW